MAAAQSTDLLNADRYRAVSIVLVRVLALNLFVAAAKIIFGYATGAVSIISDGFHSLIDSGSNVIALVGVRAARKPPDVDHPYGHRKYETLATAVIFVFLLLTLFEVLRASIVRLVHGGTAHVTTLSFIVMLCTLALNVVVVAYESRAGRRLASELLLADAMHTRSDVLTSIAVILSLIGVSLGYPLMDPVGGLIVALFIGHTGYEIAREGSNILADRIVIAEDDLRRVVLSVPDVIGCHRIRTRGPADYVFLDLHVWLRPDTRLDEAHRLSHVVKDLIMAKYPQITDVVIHIEPPPGQH